MDETGILPGHYSEIAFESPLLKLNVMFSVEILRFFVLINEVDHSKV